MVPWLVLAGIILAPSAAFFLWSWRSQRNDIALMRATETTRAGDVAKLPAGSLVEVKGRLRCAAPVTGDLSKSPCAHFAATVERDYEIVEYDSRRKTSYRVRKTEIVQSNTLFAPFEIEDDSGRAKVLPANAIIEGIAAVDRRAVADDEAGEASVMQAALGASNSPDRTLGFRYKEMHLPLECLRAGRGRRELLHRRAAGWGQGAALSDQRQIRGDARGRAGQRQRLDARARCRLLARRGDQPGSALWLTRERLSEVAPPQELLQGDRFW
jgi:E3 ubiquitin ligase